MRRRTLMAVGSAVAPLIVAALVAVGALVWLLAAKGGGPGDARRIVGTWRIESIDRGGPSDEPEAPWLDQARLTFTADGRTVWSRPGRPDREGVYKLTPTTNPKQIDWTTGVDHHGVYELDGDTLRACYPTVGGEGEGFAWEPKLERPTELKADSKQGWVLITYKRVKDEKTDK